MSQQREENEKQERSMIRDAVGGDGGWRRRSKGDEIWQMGGGEGGKRGWIGGLIHKTFCINQEVLYC